MYQMFLPRVPSHSSHDTNMIQSLCVKKEILIVIPSYRILVFHLPSRKLWTERVIELFPIGDERGRFSFVIRVVRSLCFFSIFWVTGLVALAIDGITIFWLSWLVLMMVPNCIIGLMIFVMSGWFSNRWNWFFDWSSHILELSESEFEKFRDRLERFITSFYPCFAIALVIFITTAILPQLYWIIELRTLARLYWWFGFSFVSSLIIATGLWMIISMWIGVFLTFRQPLNLKLSRWTNRDFRPLAIWSLKVSLLYFLYFTIFVVNNLMFPWMSVFSWMSIEFVTIVVFIILIGVLAFLMPFYSIHRTLVKLKQRELQEIEEDTNLLMQKLNEALKRDATIASKNSTTLIVSLNARLNILQIRERKANEVDEWPIDPNVLSMLLMIVLIPILTQIVIDILFGFFRV